MYQLFFWYILFLSSAVYSFRQNEDDTKIAAACAEGWHLNCPGPRSFPLPIPDVYLLSIPIPSMIGTA